VANYTLTEALWKEVRESDRMGGTFTAKRVEPKSALAVAPEKSG
jgi:hypothetical protein